MAFKHLEAMPGTMAKTGPDRYQYKVWMMLLRVKQVSSAKTGENQDRQMRKGKADLYVQTYVFVQICAKKCNTVQLKCDMKEII